ncbi:hypothetical protein IE53DRAFT_176370 [Violaceomyces palustris]|uniref:Uncharacterized protein n=1 Tax=Violaceomyces palustris TaxID=1673888 RepID=A0ACD0NSK1_9BASI|nr:hypothetical protein IE53DRAFT_176370 [Violaceomyces palustris]
MGFSLPKPFRALLVRFIHLGLLSLLFLGGSSPSTQVAANSASLFDGRYRARAEEDQVATATSEQELPTAAVSIEGQPPPTSYNHDPLLALMPDFAFSMPAQIVVTGINIALVAVLTIHLLFTVQYHFPLSRKNFYLQMASSVMLLVSLSVTLHIILEQLQDKSQNWPYMFPYIGVQVPPGDNSWTVVQEVFYLFMRAVTTALAHITHIQFLTLLFPSALEARLILWMLGPLAIAASGMEFTALSSDDDRKTSDLGDAIRNICNSTLTLLYTSALLIWGLMVNRRRAWRAGGGTAAFGGGSVGLAFVNTAINFTEIKYDRLWWLPNICWTLTIWQSWLGFWWWVSSGMGIGEVEDRQERLEKKRKREERRRRKQARIERQKKKAAMNASNSQENGNSEVETILGLTGIKKIKNRMMGGDGGGGDHGAFGTLNRRFRRNTSGSGADAGTVNPEEIELRNVDISDPAEERLRNNVENVEADGEARLASVSVFGGGGGINDDARTTADSGSSDTNPTTAASSSPPGWWSNTARILMEHQPNFFKARVRRLRMAHVAAARRAATEQTALREQVLNNARGQSGPGLRSMMFEGQNYSNSVMRRDSLNAGSAAGFDPTPRRSTNIGRSVSLGGAVSDQRNRTTQRATGGATTSLTDMGNDRENGWERGGGLETSSSNTTAHTRFSPLTEPSSYLESSASDTLASGSAAGVHGSQDLQGRATSARESTRLSNSRDRGDPFLTDPVGMDGAMTTRDARRRAAESDADAWVDEDLLDGGVGGEREDEDEDEDEDDDDHSNDENDDGEPKAGLSQERGRGAEALSRGESSLSMLKRKENGTSRNRDESGEDGLDEEAEESSWFWKGGLRKMRLRDRTTYD